VESEQVITKLFRKFRSYMILSGDSEFLDKHHRTEVEGVCSLPLGVMREHIKKASIRLDFPPTT
jgi:hypothetical protein